MVFPPILWSYGGDADFTDFEKTSFLFFNFRHIWFILGRCGRKQADFIAFIMTWLIFVTQIDIENRLSTFTWKKERILTLIRLLKISKIQTFFILINIVFFFVFFCFCFFCFVFFFFLFGCNLFKCVILLIYNL